MHFGIVLTSFQMTQYGRQWVSPGFEVTTRSEILSKNSQMAVRPKTVSAEEVLRIIFLWQRCEKETEWPVLNPEETVEIRSQTGRSIRECISASVAEECTN